MASNTRVAPISDNIVEKPETPIFRLRKLDMQKVIADRNRLKDQVLAEVIPKILPRQAAEFEGRLPVLQRQPSLHKSSRVEVLRGKVYKLFGMKIPTLHDRVLECAVDKIDKYLQQLIRDGDLDGVNTYDEKGQTPLIISAKIGERAVSKLLIKFQGTDLNKPERETGMTALHFAVLSKSRDIVITLCAAGAYVDFADNNGITPVMLACALPDIRTTMQLCGFRADVSLIDGQGWTPLHFAAYAGDTDICGYLLSMGADKTAHDIRQRDAQYYAEFKNHGGCVSFLELAESSLV